MNHVLVEFYRLKDSYEFMTTSTDPIKRAMATNLVRIIAFKMESLSKYTVFALLLDPNLKTKLLDMAQYGIVAVDVRMICSLNKL